MSWMPGINHDPGVLANYQRGRNRKQCVKLHYTVGVNSYNIGKRGFFQFLVPRSGGPTQFAPSDAVNWDSGDWNDAGPGIEFEYYEPKDGPAPENIVTKSQIEWGGKIIKWLAANDGYPLTFYDGPRIREHDGFRGFITHRSLVQKEQHSDYITREQFDKMIAQAPSGPSPEFVAEIQRRKKLAYEGEPTVEAHILYNGNSVYFFRRNDGKLGQSSWQPAAKPRARWEAYLPNDLAGHEDYRLKEGASIVARTKALHGVENEIELGWTGSDGKPYHTWFNYPGWGAEPLPGD